MYHFASTTHHLTDYRAPTSLVPSFICMSGWLLLPVLLGIGGMYTHCNLSPYTY